MYRVSARTPQRVSAHRRSRRDRMDLLRERVSLLTGKDKLLMTMYLENGNSVRQMAQLAGVTEASIARRIRKLTKRLLDGEYITCLRNRDRFTETEMSVAREYFLLGLSIRKIAAKRRWTYYRASRAIRKIHKILKNSS